MGVGDFKADFLRFGIAGWIFRTRIDGVRGAALSIGYAKTEDVRVLGMQMFHQVDKDLVAALG
jgi:hypothetical protein